LSPKDDPSTLRYTFTSSHDRKIRNYLSTELYYSTVTGRYMFCAVDYNMLGLGQKRRHWGFAYLAGVPRVRQL